MLVGLVRLGYRALLAAPTMNRGGPARLSVTVLHHTFYGFAILFMGGVCSDASTLPTVSYESRSQIMEMGEHSPSRGESAEHPNACCEHSLSHPRMGCVWVVYGYGCGCKQGWVRVKSVEVP